MLPSHWTTPRLQCRDVTPQDGPAVLAALDESREMTVLDPAFGPATLADIQGHIDRHLRAQEAAGPGVQALRAVQMQLIHRRATDRADADGFVGFWRLVRVPTRPEAIGVEILLVRPEHRRAGLGRELVAATAAQLHGAGRELWARVYLANARAMAFWLRAGFRRVVEHHGEWIHGLAAGGTPNLILALDLATSPENTT